MTPYLATAGYNFFLPTLVLVLLFVAFVLWCIVPPQYRRAVWFFALFIPFHMVLSGVVGTYAFMAYWGGVASGEGPSGFCLLVLVPGFILNLPLMSFSVPFIARVFKSTMDALGPWLVLTNSVIFTTIVYALFLFWRRRSTRRA